MYDQQIKEIYERCDSIKATIKKELRALVYYEVLEVLTPKRSFLLPIVQENDLEDLRKTMEKQTKELVDGRIQLVDLVFIMFRPLEAVGEEKISADSPFWKAKFNIRSVNAPPRCGERLAFTFYCQVGVSDLRLRPFHCEIGRRVGRNVGQQVRKGWRNR